MKNFSIWITIIAVILSFAGGFLLANALNKSELERIKVDNDALQDKSGKTGATENETELSSAEINLKIADAERNRDNFEYQKNLGIALYKYGALKTDAAILDSSEKILTRANQLKADDAEVLIALGNLNFDLGYNRKENTRLVAARGFYQKILDKNADDAEVRTDLALTFFLHTPPDYDQTIGELNKALQTKPGSEKALQFIIQSYVKTGRNRDAEIYLERLKAINPDTPTLKEIATQLEQNESNSAK